MNVEVKNYTYETMPDYTEPVEGAGEIIMQGDEKGVYYIPNVVYDTPDGIPLTLQIVKPGTFSEPDRRWPCIVFVQGSAWMEQNVYINVVNLGRLAEKGFVCAIVQTRHSGQAPFPAQVVDTKNAMRFLSAHASDYNVDPKRMALMGDSSGGHTAVLAGLTAAYGELDAPSMETPLPAVRGIVSYYGALDILMPDGFPSTLDHQKATSPEGKLMGHVDVNEHRAEAEKACAGYYVRKDRDLPPVFLLHGTKDRTVFCEQSVLLFRKLKNCGKDVSLTLVRGADHGSCIFWSDPVLKDVADFFHRCMPE